jgi:hypothetical protein
MRKREIGREGRRERKKVKSGDGCFSYQLAHYPACKVTPGWAREREGGGCDNKASTGVGEVLEASNRSFTSCNCSIILKSLHVVAFNNCKIHILTTMIRGGRVRVYVEGGKKKSSRGERSS